MFLGQLSLDDEYILMDIIQNHQDIQVTENHIQFDMGEKQETVSIAYQHKPCDRYFYEDLERAPVIKRCLLVELSGMKLPIFKNGEIYMDICFSNTDIKHKVYIKNPAAKQFYDYVIDIFNTYPKLK